MELYRRFSDNGSVHQFVVSSSFERLYLVSRVIKLKTIV